MQHRDREREKTIDTEFIEIEGSLFYIEQNDFKGSVQEKEYMTMTAKL